MKNILISSSLANDMMLPVQQSDPLPHKLHIGYIEATRLLGENWKNGPLLNFLKWCENTDPDKLSIVHTRDFHTLGDPIQERELAKYGPHCMAGTFGAQFIWEDQNILGQGPNQPRIVNSKKIMVATEQDFKDTLEDLVQGQNKEQVNIGIIGLLTNIKITQLALALQAEDFTNIAVCSALTASNNRRKHFEALDDMENIYGIKIINNISEFAEWLSVRRQETRQVLKYDVPIITAEESLSSNERSAVEELYSDCQAVEIKKLSGGFSGSRVYLAKGTDRSGFVQVPMILKLDTRQRIGKERMGYEKVQYVLGPHVPRIEASVERDEFAGIKYSFAMMNRRDTPTTFQAFYRQLKGSSSHDLLLLAQSLETLFNEILQPMASNASHETIQLWEANTFCERYARRTVRNINNILEGEQTRSTIEIAGVPLFNPAQFYASDNIEAKLKQPASYIRCGLAHGDLNAANILVDSTNNQWIIDFFHTGYDWPVIQDIVKLENDLKFIHTQLGSEEDLRAAIELERIFSSQQHLGQELPVLPVKFSRIPELKKLYTAVSFLRKYAAELAKSSDVENPDFAQYRIPQLRYSAHNLSFEESGPLQKKFALASTAINSERLM